jgi:hypothetical protein
MPSLWLPCTGEVVDLFPDTVKIRPCTDGAVAEFNLPICLEPIKILEAGQFFLTGADVSDKLIFIMLLIIT